MNYYDYYPTPKNTEARYNLAGYKIKNWTQYSADDELIGEFTRYAIEDEYDGNQDFS